MAMRGDAMRGRAVRGRAVRGESARTGAARTGAPPPGVAPVLALACALAGCAAPGEGDVDQAPAETVALEVDVKRALLESDAVGGAAIGVVVGEGGDETGVRTLTLEGFVGSEDERAEALRLARGAAGGARVVDALEVR